MVLAGLFHVPAALTPYSLSRRLGEPHSRIKGRREEIILGMSGLVSILADRFRILYNEDIRSDVMN
jgi:hypothetical protein